MVDSFVILAPLLLLPVVGLLRFIGCASFTEAPADAVVIKIDPDQADLGPGESKQFTARAEGIATTAVTWSPNAPGGLYKAADPRVVSVSKDTITATSTASPTSPPGSATVNLKAVTVVVSPAVVSLKPGENQTFTAKVQPTADPNVTWTNAPNGLFVAPSPYKLGAAAVTISATANADPSATPGTATVNLIGSGARFVTADAATKGSWKGIYGGAGWALAALPTNLVNRPAFVSVLNLPAVPAFSFADPSTDPRALQRPPMFLDRFAAVWFDNAVVQLDLEFTDFKIHRVAIYAVDWDTTARAQKFEILDNSTPPIVLDTRTLSAFNGGQYLIWDLSGKVTIRATRTAGVNALISAIFFE